MIVLRNEEIKSLLLKRALEKQLFLEPLTEDDTLQSQDAGIRHRQIYIKYRQLLYRLTDLNKRHHMIRPLSLRERLTQRLRMRVREYTGELKASCCSAKEVPEVLKSFEALNHALRGPFYRVWPKVIIWMFRCLIKQNQRKALKVFIGSSCRSIQT